MTRRGFLRALGLASAAAVTAGDAARASFLQSGARRRRPEAPSGARLHGVSSLTSGRANAAGLSLPERVGSTP